MLLRKLFPATARKMKIQNNFLKVFKVKDFFNTKKINFSGYRLSLVGVSEDF
jgi:hypothetical protein